MSDLLDRATTREAEILADCLAEHRRRAGLAGKTIEDSAHVCVACDEVISDARRAAYPGVRLCVDCKTQQEKQERMAREC